MSKHRSKRSNGFHLDKTAWLVIGVGGGIALYLMLLGGYTGVKPLDAGLHGIGNTIGIEGVGKEYLPDFLTGEEKRAMFADDEDFGDTDVTVA
jgi:hypothetical protein